MKWQLKGYEEDIRLRARPIKRILNCLEQKKTKINHKTTCTKYTD